VLLAKGQQMPKGKPKGKKVKKVVINPDSWVDPKSILPYNDDSSVSLKEGIDYVASILESTDARECPCCGQIVKLYPRKLHSKMAAFLCSLVHFSRKKIADGWVHIRKINIGEKASTDASYLVHWGLVERDNKGSYRPTKNGKAFARGKLEVPSHAMVYDRDHCLGVSNMLVSVDEALGEEFSREELLYGRWE